MRVLAAAGATTNQLAHVDTPALISPRPHNPHPPALTPRVFRATMTTTRQDAKTRSTGAATQPTRANPPTAASACPCAARGYEGECKRTAQHSNATAYVQTHPQPLECALPQLAYVSLEHVRHVVTPQQRRTGLLVPQLRGRPAGGKVTLTCDGGGLKKLLYHSCGEGWAGQRARVGGQAGGCVGAANGLEGGLQDGAGRHVGEGERGGPGSGRVCVRKCPSQGWAGLRLRWVGARGGAVVLMRLAQVSWKWLSLRSSTQVQCPERWLSNTRRHSLSSRSAAAMAKRNVYSGTAAQRPNAPYVPCHTLVRVYRTKVRPYHTARGMPSLPRLPQSYTRQLRGEGRK